MGLIDDPTKTYLSVDLDFFNNRKEQELIRLCHDIRNKVEKRDIILVESHEDIVDHCASLEPDLLINVDTHSDLTENTSTKIKRNVIDCGNWVNFSKAKKYRWLAPDREVVKGEGRCDDTEHFFNKKGAHLRDIKDVAIWYGLSKIPWESVKKVGIALSIEYTSRPILRTFIKKCYPELKKARMAVCTLASTIKYVREI